MSAGDTARALEAEEESLRRLRPKGRFRRAVAADWNKIPLGTPLTSNEEGLKLHSMLLPMGGFVARSVACLQAAMVSRSKAESGTAARALEPAKQTWRRVDQMWDPSCFVCVRLQIRGRGTAETGAAVLAPGGGGPVQAGTLLGYVTSAMLRGGKTAVAVCHAAMLWRLAAGPKAPSLAALRTAVGVQNPRSEVVSRAGAVVMLDETLSKQQTGCD